MLLLGLHICNPYIIRCTGLECFIRHPKRTYLYFPKRSVKVIPTYNDSIFLLAILSSYDSKIRKWYEELVRYKKLK